MAEFINNLSEYIHIIVSGYIFVTIFNFVMYKKNMANYNHIFFKSIVYGFILKSVLYTAIILIPIKDEFKDVFRDSLFYISSAVLSYAITVIMRSSRITKVMMKLGVYRNHNNNIWLDIFDGENPPWFDVSSSTLKKHYSGELDILEDTPEDFQRKPILILRKYKSYDENENIIEDRSNDCNFKVIIDTGLYDDIKFAYPKNDETNTVT